MQKQLPTRILTWLLNRKISLEIIERYGIDYAGNKIVIPVHDEKGNVLFNKYRRDPEASEGPKYQYDKGATSALYGLMDLSPKLMKVVICEGELDALCLMSQNIPAVSSTGGSGTFKAEWAKYFDAIDTYICFDTDGAGLEGALRVQRIIPHAKIVLLPKTVKDVTEFYMSDSSKTFAFYLMEASSYVLPPNFSTFKKKKEAVELKKALGIQVEQYLIMARNAREKYNHELNAILQIIIGMYNEQILSLTQVIRYFNATPSSDNKDKVARAKAVPIPLYVKFGRDKFGKCVFHDDSKPSMYYYEKQNRVKCFSCGKLGDVIDVVQALRAVNFSGALDIILNEHGKTA